MPKPELIVLLVILVPLNGLTYFLVSEDYTAWSIQTRNRLLHLIFRKDSFRIRADNAYDIAIDVVRWARPFALLSVNIGWILLVINRWQYLW